MKDDNVSICIDIEGMSCPACEQKIEKALKKLEGVISVKVSYSNENAYLEYDSTKIKLSEIKARIEEVGYKVKSSSEKRYKKLSNADNQNKSKDKKKMVILLIITFILFYIFHDNLILNYAPEINENLSYGMLFVIGLLTSFHCIAMCGGINIYGCSKVSKNSNKASSKLFPSLLYNLGRVVSYTVIGGIVGAIGKAVTFTGTLQVVVIILSGIFMTIMGINMLNIFPFLRKVVTIIPKILKIDLEEKLSSKGPFVIGLLNGFMPCGPLQAMQIYALSTGSIFKGVISMLIFSVGTVPLMFLLGYFSSLMNSGLSKKMMKISAFLVFILGLSMITRGLNLSGITLPSFTINTQESTNYNTNSPSSSKDGKKYNNTAVINEAENIQEVTIKFTNGRYYPITVQKGIKVKWIIEIDKYSLNGCNNEIRIPKYGVVKKLKAEENIVEFTPTETGAVVYTCWMGMQRSYITVVDNLEGNSSSNSNLNDINNSLDEESSVYSSSGGCCAVGN